MNDIELNQESIRDAEELTQLKEETIEHIVDKILERSQAAKLLWKKTVTEYIKDGKHKMRIVILKFFANIVTSPEDEEKINAEIGELKDFQIKINNIKTKEELYELERSTIESQDKSDNNKDDSENNASQSEAFSDSVDANEAKNVPLKKREKWLFPKWTPDSEVEMKKYLKKIVVPIHTPQWRQSKHTLHVHEKLAPAYKAAFQEMFEKWIPVNPRTTYSFSWRKMRNWKKLSHHAYGSAIDINPEVNGWVYWVTDRKSPYFNSQHTVEIWKKYWFYRWWDRKKKNYDPMHFSYMNK